MSTIVILIFNVADVIVVGTAANAIGQHLGIRRKRILGREADPVMVGTTSGVEEAVVAQLVLSEAVHRLPEIGIIKTFCRPFRENFGAKFEMIVIAEF